MQNKTVTDESETVPMVSEEWTNKTMLNKTLTVEEEANEWNNYQVIVSIVLGVISITTVLANSFVLILFFKSKKVLRSPSYILLANLGLADLLVGVIVMPILTTVTVAKNYRWYWGKEICWAFDYFHYLLCATSMFSMVGVAVEQFIGVRYPLRHKSIVSRSRATKAAGFCWILAFLMTAIPLTIWPQSQPFPRVCLMNLNQPFVLLISFAVYWVPVTLTILMYTIIFCFAIKPLFTNLTQDSSLQSTFSKKNHFKDNSKSSKPQVKFREDKLVAAKKRQTVLAKKLAFVIFAMLVMFGSPLFAVYILKGLDSEIFTCDLLFFTGWVRDFNSCINPFVFAFNVPGYRKEFYRIFLNERTETSDEDESLPTWFCGLSDNDKVHQPIDMPEKSRHQNDYESKGSPESKPVTRFLLSEDALVRFCTYCGKQMTRGGLKHLGVNMPRFCTQCFRRFESGRVTFSSCAPVATKSALKTKQKVKTGSTEKNRIKICVGDSGDFRFTLERSMMLEIHKYLQTLNDNMAKRKCSLPESLKCKS